MATLPRNPEVATNRSKRHPERQAFLAAKQRCSNPAHRDYAYYGGRGIRFLFSSFEQFAAELGPKPSPKHSIDRIENDGHYEPGNVRWALPLQQIRNRSFKANKSGHTGVYHLPNRKGSKKYRAVVYLGYKPHFKNFATLDEAVAAIPKMRAELWADGGQL